MSADIALDMSLAIITAGYASAGVDIFRWRAPDTPANAVVVTGTPGRRALKTMGGPDIERPGFQVLVRNTDEKAAMTLCELIRKLFTNNVSVTGYTLIDSVQSRSELILPDEKNRYFAVCNFEVIM